MINSFRCGVSEEQFDYQREMERKYQEFQQLLAPLIGTGKKAQLHQVSQPGA